MPQAELMISQEDINPHHRFWAWNVPAHYMKEARGLVDDLLKAGIISEVKKPVKWCTEGFLSRETWCTWETAISYGLQGAQPVPGVAGLTVSVLRLCENTVGPRGEGVLCVGPV